MVSFLTQLRTGYIDRSRVPFPHSLALIGRRLVRDYTISAEKRRAVAWLATSSPFKFDLRKELTWDERLYLRDEQVEGKTIHVVGS